MNPQPKPRLEHLIALLTFHDIITVFLVLFQVGLEREGFEAFNTWIKSERFFLIASMALHLLVCKPPIELLATLVTHLVNRHVVA